MLYEDIMESVDFIRTRETRQPKIGLILGSGLGSLAESLEDATRIPYSEIPHFPGSNVPGHEAQLVIGNMDGTEVAVMQGRFHYYEGHGMQRIVYPIYVLRKIGVEMLIITNACGAVNPEFRPGDLMIISDYINLLGLNPLIGENDERLGPRFPDMSEAFSKQLREKAGLSADRLGLTFRTGVYAFFNGPCFETAAEIRAYRVLGADTVGMSTVPETIAANYLGMKVLGIACITNMATGLAKEKHSHEEVLRTANESSENLCRWIKDIVRAI